MTSNNEDKQMAKGHPKNEPKKKETILVVEDEDSSRDMLSHILGHYGYSIISAKDGQDGWEKFKTNRPDLVISDLVMPGVDGLELLRLIKNEDPSIPVIIFTGYYSRESKAIRLGADDIIEKSTRIIVLLGKVENALKKSETERVIHYYKNISEAITSENKTLRGRIEKLSESKDHVLEGKEIEKYRAICGAVAHGLKSEFMHIGYSLKEIRESDNTSQEIIDESDSIGRSLEYSRILLQRLLNFLDMGSLQVEPIELLELLKKTEVLATPRLPSTIQLQIEIAQNIANTKISANFEQLMGVLLELINNASQALRQKGGTIELKLEEKNNQVEISVKDDGPGIPAKLRKKILKEQVPSKGGLGYGLYLCGKVIAELGGSLNMPASAGKGTTFTIVLPKIQEKKES